MTIKHLVIGGGGPFGLSAFGAFKYLHDQSFWNIKDIKTIYATSIGSLVGLYLCLNYDYEYINEYIVKRPWEKIFEEIGIQNIFELYKNKGLIDPYPILKKKFNILFEAKGLSENISMKEFYEYSGIELNFITCDANSFSKIIISHKTFPDTEVVKALCMTSAFPIIFKPISIDNKCFIDGGVFSNYAVNICLEETGCKKDEILGVKKYDKDGKNEHIINDDSNIFDYLEKIYYNIYNKISDELTQEAIPYHIEIDMNIFTSYEGWIQVPFSSEHRNMLIMLGVKYATELLPSFILHRDLSTSSS